MTVSTKREDVARVRDRLRDPASSNAWNREAADMLDALLDERDDEKLRADTNSAAHEAAMRYAKIIEAERDAARADGMREAVNIALATSDSMIACEIAAAILAAAQEDAK
jgi:esterase/lipase